MASGSILAQPHSVPAPYARKKKRGQQKKKRDWEEGPDKKEPVPLVSFPPIILTLVKETALLGSIRFVAFGAAKQFQNLDMWCLVCVPYLVVYPSSLSTIHAAS